MTNSAKSDAERDRLLIGVGASPGIAIGRAFVLARACPIPLERRIAPDEIDAEVHHFLEAIELSKRQLRETQERLRDRTLAEHLYIIDAHLLILEDQMLVDDTLALIRSELVNAEGALRRNLARFRQIFDSIEDEYLRERRSDIDSVGDRLLRNLAGESHASLQTIDRKAIIVAHDLSPADTLQIDKERVIGFMTDAGGRTSHTAILARSLGIPAVVGLESATMLAGSEMPVIIDGCAGVVVLNPSPESFREYLHKKRQYESRERELLAYRDLPAETRDGVRMVLRGNLELVEEVPAALANGADGIGLFRTEFLYMNRSAPPSEDEQLAIYREMVARMAPAPVTIRTLDVGGDKFVPDINLADEPNPAMGLRAIRFSLKEQALFKTQLRAILRASACGRVRVLFPMISGVAEVRACKAVLREAMAELRAAGHPFDAALPVGVMIETPSAALIAPLLAREADFFSVGTNDLIQYCLAVDRGNEHVAYLYEPLHPAILRALQLICRAGREAGIEVAMCGEMAAEPLYTPVLIGLGFTELSMNAPDIPRVKRILRQVTRAEGEALLAELLAIPVAREITRHLEETMARRFPELFQFAPIGGLP